MDTKIKIKTTNSRCIARFFPFKERSTLDGDNTDQSMESKEIREDDSIIACSIGREKSSPAATWQLTLKPEKNFYNIIKPGDWVMIYLDDSSNIDIKALKGLKIVGVVNRVAYNKTTLNDGGITTNYTIHGSDFGKLFEVSEFFYNPYAPESVIKAVIAELQLRMQGNPQDFITALIDIFLGNAKTQQVEQVLFSALVPKTIYEALGGQEKVKGSAVSFYDILDKSFDSATKEGFNLFNDLNRINAANLWTAMQQVANTVVNELYTDLVNGKPTLKFRKQPLKISDALSMAKNAIELTEADIINQNLGVGDHEVFNYLYLMASQSIIGNISYSVAAANKAKFPYIGFDSTKRFGLRRIERTTDYGYKTADFDFDLMVKWADELKEYWFNAHRLENGTIEVLGINNFQIGEFIKIKEQNRIYRIESVNWSWSFGQTIFTSLTVGYGIQANGSYVDQDKDENLKYGTSFVTRRSDVRYE